MLYVTGCESKVRESHAITGAEIDRQFAALHEKQEIDALSAVLK
jgi:hypothetical protein